MSFITTAIGTKVAIAAISLAALGGGTAIAAAAGVLPTSHTFASESETPDPTDSESPDPTPDPTSSDAAHGPDATGPAAFGLCTAYTAGGLSSHSTAYKALLAASAGGDIKAYCGTVLANAPGHSGDHAHGGPAPEQTGAPTTHSHGGKHGNAGTHAHGH